MFGQLAASWLNSLEENRSSVEPIVKTFDSAMHQLKLIIDLLGTPKECDIQNIENPKFREMIRNIPIRPPKKLTKIFPNCNEEGKRTLISNRFNGQDDGFQS